MIAIIGVVALIIKGKVDPVISLIIGSLYLGLATGVGFTGTIGAITTGFGEIMAEVGLLIGFGVLIGSLLHAMGAFQKMVELLVNGVGGRRLPYALTAAMSTIFPSIYVDVQVVLASPVVRSAGPLIGRRGLPLMAGALGTGIFAGYVFVVPGLAAVSIAGLMGIPLGTWILYGIVLGPLTAIATTLIFRQLLRGRYWKPAADEELADSAELADGAEADGAGPSTTTDETDAPATDRPRTPPLLVCLLPILVPLVMIGGGAFAELFGVTSDAVAFIGDANLALFVGLLGAYLLARRTLGSEGTNNALGTGFHTTGEILLITGIGGSLGAVIAETGLDEILAGLFSGRRRRPDRAQHPARLGDRRRGAAPGDRLGLGGLDRRGRDHRPGARLDRRRPDRHRPRRRLRRHVRPPGQQQLLLDVQVADRALHAGHPEDAHDSHLHRVAHLPAARDGDRAPRLISRSR